MSGNNTRAEIIARFPPQKKTCCGYEKCPPTLSGGCYTSYCGGDYNISPLCNAIGITGLVGDAPCILFDDQLGRECVGCKKDCNFPEGCPIYLPY